MALNFYNRQKSLKRRFLLLSSIRLICFIAVGLTIIFWNKININGSNTQKLILGALFIGYGILRFALSYKNAPDG